MRTGPARGATALVMGWDNRRARRARANVADVFVGPLVTRSLPGVTGLGWIVGASIFLLALVH